MASELVHMAGMGLLTSVVAPAAVLLGRDRPALQRLAAPPWVTLPGFVVLHALVLTAMAKREPAPPVHVTLDTILLAGAVAFWLPVLGLPWRRLDDVGRCVYLFLAAPSLDLPAVVLVARGNSVGGLAMIVAMLPIGLAAVALMWRVLTEEEAAVRRVEVAERRSTSEVPYADS